MTIDNNPPESTVSVNSPAIVVHDDAEDTGDTPTAQATQQDTPTENEEPITYNDEIRTAATTGGEHFIPASAVEPAPTGVKCQLCPLGVYTVFPALFASMAWLASLSKDGCDYARITGPIVADITNDPDVPFIDAGFRHYRQPRFQDMEWITDQSIKCEPYNTDIVSIDGVWVFANMTSFLALVFGGSAALFIWFASFLAFRKKTWRWAGYELLLAVGFQALSFVWFANNLCDDNDCKMHYGAKVDIVASVLWLVASLFIFCKYPKGYVISQGEGTGTTNQQATQEVTEIEMANQSQSQETPEIV